jgi:putative addiction module component (TIGR02574 family)
MVMQLPIPAPSPSTVSASFYNVFNKTKEFFMGTADLQALFALSPAERIELAEDLWDSVAQEAAGQPLKAHEIAEIEKRLAEHRANPQDVVPWATVRANLGLV